MEKNNDVEGDINEGVNGEAEVDKLLKEVEEESKSGNNNAGELEDFMNDVLGEGEEEKKEYAPDMVQKQEQLDALKVFKEIRGRKPRSIEELQDFMDKNKPSNYK